MYCSYLDIFFSKLKQYLALASIPQHIHNESFFLDSYKHQLNIRNCFIFISIDKSLSGRSEFMMAIPSFHLETQYFDRKSAIFTVKCKGTNFVSFPLYIHISFKLSQLSKIFWMRSFHGKCMVAKIRALV